MKRVTTLYAAMLLAASALTMAPGEARAQYPRTVLLEEFTSVTCKPCTTATPIINSLIEQKQGRVVSIRYHMNFPSEGDPWYEANTQHNGARAQYYTVQSLPYGRLDGAVNVSVTSEGDVFDKAEDRLSQQSPILLEVTQTREGNQANVRVKATAGADLSDGHRLHVVALESHIHDERFQGGKWNNEKDFEDVMRTLVTGSEGAEFAIASEDVKELTFQYTIGEGWQANQMYVVAFVQNDFTKQIVQAGYSEKPPRNTGSVHEQVALAGYSLDQSFPNPARAEAEIAYAIGIPGEVTLELHNTAGEIVARMSEGVKEAGPHRLRLDLSGVSAGAYTYTLRSGRYRASGMMTVVK